MSRIGNMPITVPETVTVKIVGNDIEVKGPKGTLNRNFRPEMEFVQDGNTISVKCRDNSQRTVAFSGLSRTLLNNMIISKNWTNFIFFIFNLHYL